MDRNYTKRMEAKLINDIAEINRRLAFNLWYLANVKSTPQGLSPRLVLPQKRSGEIRISEQESRVLYCGILNTLNYYYSIETPTEEVYQQTGQIAISASSDLSIYVYEKDFQKVANVEFKAHNPDEKQIRKDIEKLIREGIPGNWFHTLKNIDSGTLRSLFQKFINAFTNLSNIAGNNSVSIYFCFCVLEKKWACAKHFLYDSSQGDLASYAEEFFNLRYFVKSRRIQVQEENGWQIFSA